MFKANYIYQSVDFCFVWFSSGDGNRNNFWPCRQKGSRETGGLWCDVLSSQQTHQALRQAGLSDHGTGRFIVHWLDFMESYERIVPEHSLCRLGDSVVQW